MANGNDITYLQWIAIHGNKNERNWARRELNQRLRLFIEMKNAAKALVKMSRNR
jgi:hypothetical protein